MARPKRPNKKKSNYKKEPKLSERKGQGPGPSKWPWAKWKAEWIATDPAEVRTLREFSRFVENKVSINTWSYHTTDWHQLRNVHWDSIHKRALAADKKAKVEMLRRRQKRAALINDLVVKDLVVNKGGQQALRKMGAKDAIRLYDVTSNEERQIIELERKLMEAVAPPQNLLGVQVNVDSTSPGQRPESDLIDEIESRIARYTDKGGKAELL